MRGGPLPRLRFSMISLLFCQQTIGCVCSVPCTVPGWGTKTNPTCLWPWQLTSKQGEFQACSASSSKPLGRHIAQIP